MGLALQVTLINIHSGLVRLEMIRAARAGGGVPAAACRRRRAGGGARRRRRARARAIKLGGIKTKI